MKRVWGVIIAVVAAAVTGVVGCSNPTLHPYCTDIPALGCPGDSTSHCSDGTCEAIYSRSADCVWTFVARCPRYGASLDGGAHDALVDAEVVDARADASRARDGNAPTRDAAFAIPDGAAGGPGCPDLESPDCPLAEALQCGSSCCGCESLYVCQSGGWDLFAECGDGGAIVPVTQ